MKQLLLVFISFSYIIVNGQNLSKNVEVKLEKELKDFFKDHYSTKQKIQVKNEQLGALSFNYPEDEVYQLKDVKNNVIGFAYVGKTKSKVSLFDYVVLFDKNLIISKVKVLIYREDHGGEITHKRWLAQFNGLEKNQTILYKKDIAGISGATISASSLTNAVNNVLKTMTQLQLLKLI